MLDVHPAHHAATTWRDFFIHIATIVLGLLIAIGLEQSIEWLHHRHQLQEFRAALKQERTDNRQAFVANTQGVRSNLAALRNNLLVLTYLKGHPGTPRAALPGVLIWPNWDSPFSDISWRSAANTNIAELMPREELAENAALYEWLMSLNQVSIDSWKAVSRASSYVNIDPDLTHFSPAGLDHEIELTQDALLAKETISLEMSNLARYYKDFGPGPSKEGDLFGASIVPPLTPEQQRALESARAQTNARMAATPMPNP
jgi:hypothetical protein